MYDSRYRVTGCPSQTHCTRRECTHTSIIPCHYLYIYSILKKARFSQDPCQKKYARHEACTSRRAVVSRATKRPSRDIQKRTQTDPPTRQAPLGGWQHARSRRKGDSNPWYDSSYASLAMKYFRPLSHLSTASVARCKQRNKRLLVCISKPALFHAL